MITANRKKLANRSIKCFLRQSYKNKELIIIDDGRDDYSNLLSTIPVNRINYVRIKNKEKLNLGELRNISLDIAKGDYIAQWDDDDWYHADRLTVQANVINKGFEACCLESSLTHINSPEFKNLPFIGTLNGGIPGSIMHVNSKSIRYPDAQKGEDTVYLNNWKKKKYTSINKAFGYLFIRCYHGNNTWDLNHFKRRIHNSPTLTIQYIWYNYFKRDMSEHPIFKLEKKFKNAFYQYKEDSIKLDLF